MSIAPQRRTSKTRKRLRRTHYKLDLPGMMVCPNCGELKLAHIVCKSCGYYDGKLVKEIPIKEDEEKVTEVKTDKKAKKEAKKEVKKAKSSKKEQEK